MFKSKKMLLIIVAVAIVGIGSAGMLVIKPHLAGHGKDRPQADPVEPPHNLVLEDFTVNLADMDRPRYLKATIAIAFAKEPEIEEAKQAEPQIRDVVIMTLTRHYFRELLTRGGKRSLRDELKSAINGRIGPLGLQAEEVVFTAFVME